MLDGLVVDSNGTQNYFQNGQLHRFDGPAVVYIDGTQQWFVKGKDITEDLSRYFNKNLSRKSLTKSELLIFRLKWNGTNMLNGLVVDSNGTQRWYQNNLLHRLDGPAVVYADSQEWYQNDQLHRLGGPAIIRADGTQGYYQNNQRHRLGGPAIVYADGAQQWYQNGQLHRLDGPATIYADGSQKWFVKGKDITRELSRYFNKNLSRESLTKSELLIFKLKWN